MQELKPTPPGHQNTSVPPCAAVRGAWGRGRDPGKGSDLQVQHFSVQKNQGIPRDILGGSGDGFFHGEMGEIISDFFHSHVRG